MFSVRAEASTNVLTNPGAENGLTGWNTSISGYIYAVSTNGLQGGAGSLHLLAHSGTNTFQMFDTTADSASMYQDFAAAAGSQWAASCWAICYASNYFNPGANAHMEVVFFDATNGVLASSASSSGMAGTYGTDFLDPSGSPDPVNITWIFAPSMATDASGWLYLSTTNLYSTVPATEPTWESPVSPLTTNFTAPAGTAYVRYMLQFANSGTDGGAVYFDDCVLNKLVGTDPDIFTQSGPVTVLASGAAQFSVVATKAVKPEVLLYQWQQNGTNLPPAGGINGIAGSTTNAILSISNCQDVAAGLYSCLVSDTNGSIRSVPVSLTVQHLSPLQRRNLLGVNSGLEGNPIWAPWNFFNGAYLQTVANTYPGSTTPVNIYEGTTVALSGDNGDRDNGFWQSVPVAPGSLCKAAGHAYISSADDFIGGNTCRLQIWFKDSTGATVPGTSTYESFKMYGSAYTNADMMYTNIDTSSPNWGQVGFHAQLPRDQWVYLPVSNVVNNAGIGLGDDLPYDTLPAGVFAVPTNASQVNVQVYEYCPVAADPPTGGYGGNGADSVYWDGLELFLVDPVTNLTSSVSGNNFNLSFSAEAGLAYTVLYKTNLADATWSVLANNVTAPISWATNPASPGISYPVTVSDPLTASHRFYRVQSH
jgi:hypothetical protein